MRPVANIISFAFHPLLLTTYLVLVLGFYFPTLLGIKPDAVYQFALLIFIVTCVFPGLCLMFMLRFMGVPSLELSSRRDRIIPFVLMTCMYAAMTGMFIYKAVFGTSFTSVMVIVAALVAIATVITFFYKISVHSLAIGGCIAILTAMNRISGVLLIPLVVTILIAGVVMSSRLVLNAHTPRQVLLGALIGFVAGMGGMIVLF